MGSLFLSPLIGFLVYRFGKEEAFIASGAIFLSSLLFFVPTASSFIPLLILIAVFTAFVPTPIFSLPAKLVEPQNLGVGFGIFTMCQNIGILAGPYLAGLMKDLTGQYLSSFYLISLFAILVAVTISILNMMRTKATLSKC